jgi:drug/metabolite transporter (DMT)-like permease
LEAWQISALGALFFLAAYALAVKHFFNSNYDWRAFIPFIAVASIVLIAYFAYSGAYFEVKPDSYAFAAFLSVIFVLSSAASFIAMREGPIGTVVPIFSLNLVLVAVGGALFFGEQMTLYKLAGILAGLASIFLLTFEGK